MKIDCIILLIDKDFGEFEGSYEELFFQIQDNGINILSSLHTSLYSNKIRKVEILGLEYLMFFKDSKLFYKINLPEFNHYLRKLKQARPDRIIEGFQFFPIKKKDKWQVVNINTINYQDEEVYHLLVALKY